MCHVLALLFRHNRTIAGWVCLHNFVHLKPVLCLSFTWIADIVFALFEIRTDCTESNTSVLHTFFYYTALLIDVHEKNPKKTIFIMCYKDEYWCTLAD